MSSQHSKGGEKEKRKPVRRDPEKRRQQNAQAQRKYREKFRQRLGQLETLATSAAQHDLGHTLATATLTSNTPTHLTSNESLALLPSDISASSPSVETPAGCQDLQHFDDPSALGLWNSTTHIPTLNEPSALTLWDTTTHVDPSILMCDKRNDGLDPYWTTTIACNCATPHVRVRTQGLDPFTYNQVKLLKIEPSITADLYANNFRIQEVCTISALHALGMHIGITEELLCADEALSPFYRFSADPTDPSQAIKIGRVQMIFKTLKPDMRPNTEQITVKHHPCIDVFPFPTLRKNLIIQQDEIDEDEFWHDMLTGLVCWGGAGVGKRDRNESTGYASTGTPWDVRSWEGRVWFLKKYWSLLGGEDGELVRQSEWWRSMRGEDTLDMEVQV